MDKPQDVMDAYRAELRRLYGDEIAKETILYYKRGWYYLSMARRHRDGSVGAFTWTTPHRKKAILEMIENLRGREVKK